MYYVYILKSQKDLKKYIGLTDNLTRRISQHNEGKCDATKNRRPLQLIYAEKFDSRAEAAKREKFYKTGKGREYIKNTLNL